MEWQPHTSPQLTLIKRQQPGYSPSGQSQVVSSACSQQRRTGPPLFPSTRLTLSLCLEHSSQTYTLYGSRLLKDVTRWRMAGIYLNHHLSCYLIGFIKHKASFICVQKVQVKPSHQNDSNFKLNKHNFLYHYFIITGLNYHLFRNHCDQSL